MEGGGGEFPSKRERISMLLEKLQKKISHQIVYIRKYGLAAEWAYITKQDNLDLPDELPAPEESNDFFDSYDAWRRRRLPNEQTLQAQQKTVFPYMPKISILVPLYHTPEKFLRKMLDSVISQTYANWELCLVNASPENQGLRCVVNQYREQDKQNRIILKELDKNEGIAANTNEALKLATGDFIGLLDHDDMLSPAACYEAAKCLNQHRDTDVLYTDEDKVNAEGTYYYFPHFKPEFNLDLLRTNNYICHFFLVRRELANQLGGLRSEYDGAQDYDFIFRCCERAREIQHIPKALYHWRTHEASVAQSKGSKMYCFDAGKRAIEAHLKRTDSTGIVIPKENLGFYRVQYPVQEEPLVSIILIEENTRERTPACIRSILQKTDYPHYEIIIVEKDNGKGTLSLPDQKALSGREGPLSAAGKPLLRRVAYKKRAGNNGRFAMKNFGALQADGEYLLFLDNMVEGMNEAWLREMLGHCQRREVGVVGAKLYYTDNIVYHAGIILGRGGLAAYAFNGLDGTDSGYFDKACLQANFSAVSGACMMVKKTVYEEVGGFDKKIKNVYNDVDFCVRVGEKGYLTVYTPYATAYYHGLKRTSPERVMAYSQRLTAKEKRLLRKRLMALLPDKDPAFNPNWELSLEAPTYALKQEG